MIAIRSTDKLFLKLVSVILIRFETIPILIQPGGQLLGLWSRGHRMFGGVAQGVCESQVDGVISEP